MATQTIIWVFGHDPLEGWASQFTGDWKTTLGAARPLALDSRPLTHPAVAHHHRQPLSHHLAWSRRHRMTEPAAGEAGSPFGPGHIRGTTASQGGRSPPDHRIPYNGICGLKNGKQKRRDLRFRRYRR
ncbi:hypothetical protein Acsp01_54080 [Actinoplanes sp. NBRC 101535]|nr:hypothetical protein Acsp01_54080 [Actinoplanes sp. NBRC 101535]